MSWSDGLHPELRPYFEALVRAMGQYDPTTRVTSGYRSTQQQTVLYRRFQAGLIPGPVAPPGYSYHEYGRAIDVLADEQTLKLFGELWEEAGGRWGGHFHGAGKYDPVHYEA